MHCVRVRAYAGVRVCGCVYAHTRTRQDECTPDTLRASQAQLPGRGILGQPKQTEQERVIERMFQMDEVRCLQNNKGSAPPRGLPSKFRQLAHMSPMIVKARSHGPLDLSAASSDSSQHQSRDDDQSWSYNEQGDEDEGAEDEGDASTAQMLEFEGDAAGGQHEDDGVEMAGFTIKGNAMRVPTNYAGRECQSPQLPQRPPSQSMSPITVGCLPEFMPSPLDLHDKMAEREHSSLEMVRRDITAAGSNLGVQLAKCVAQFDAQWPCFDANVVYDSDNLERADFTIDECDKERSDEEDETLAKSGKGLMTMGFEVPLGGDGGEDGDSCLEVFFGYVRRGIANEVLRALRRWALDGSERDAQGNTAVHIAAIHGSKHIVEVAARVYACVYARECFRGWM
jgi:hypothetical protein